MADNHEARWERIEAEKADYAYRQWMAAVDAELVSRVGVGADDLPDCLYRDWFDSGMTAAEAARQAVEECEGAEDLLAEWQDYGGEG